MELLLRTDRFNAHLLRQILAMHGITVHVFNEHMQGAVGEIPAEAALPQVWLDDADDRTRAMAVLSAQRREGSRQGSHFCRGCAEENPIHFELCWQCGQPI